MEDILISKVGKYLTPIVRYGLWSIGLWLTQRGCYTEADAESLAGEATAITAGLVTLGFAYAWSVWKNLKTDEAALKLATAAAEAPAGTPVKAVQVAADMKPSAL